MSEISIKITNPTLKLSFLADLVQAIDRDGIDNLLRKGLRPSFIDDLRQRPTRDLVDAAAHAHLEMAINVNPSHLEGCFARIDLVRADEKLKEYFVTHGASAILLKSMFKLSKLEAGMLRDQFGIEAHPPTGRTPMPTECERDAIHVAWDSILKSYPQEQTREQFYRLHQQFQQFTPNALWQVTKEFDHMSADPKPVTRKPL
jgi:hypothetical protein